MDARVERNHKEKVLRRVAAHLESAGYRRSKPTFYTRGDAHVIEFVHIHKFTFEPSFRVHAGLRVVNDPFPAAALNGPASDDPGRRPGGLDYSYQDSEESLDRCALHIRDFVSAVIEPWFESHRDRSRLARSRKSPLSPAAREALALALAGTMDEQLVAQTRRLLGAP